MSRISNLTKYPYDYNITEKDFVIGTNGDNNNKKTKNFPVVALAEYVRNFNNNLSYDRVISIGEITSENNNITINVNDLGNVVYINHTFYTKNTSDTFTFTPVTEGVKIILLYALPDEQIFYMLEGVQSIEAVEPTLPSGALFVQRIIVTVDGIEIIPNNIIISDNKVQITENTSFANIGQSQKDFNKNVSDYKINVDLKNQEQDDRLTDIEDENAAQNDLINDLSSELDFERARNDAQDSRLENLEGINYIWSPTNRTLTLFDNNGIQLSQVSLVSLDNEGTDIRYNASTLSLELYNADNELLDSIPVSSFIGSVGTQLQLNSNQLQLKDSQGNILSTVNFSVSNINGLQAVLDTKFDKEKFSPLSENYIPFLHGSSYFFNSPFYVDATNYYVGLNKTNPTEYLDVNGNIKASGFKKDGGTSNQALTADGNVFDLTTKADLVDGKVPKAQSQPSTMVMNNSTYVITFTDATGAVQSIDLPLESLFKDANYDETTKSLIVTLQDGTTRTIPLSDLVDLPEIVLATSNPAVTPTTGQKVYFNTSLGKVWFNVSGAWVFGGNLISDTEKTNLSTAYNHSQTTGNPHNTTKADIGLGNVDNTSDLNKPISTATQNALNGKQNVLTNPITGTGTTNYIPKFTSSGTIGNSQIQDDGIGIGIGSAPSSTDNLYIFSSTNKSSLRLRTTHSSSNSEINLQTVSGSAISQLDYGGNYVFRTYQADMFFDNLSTNGTIRFRTGGSNERMRIDNNGNVGIGTTSPTEKLDVNGYVKATGFKTPNGTSTQFLMADGSVNSTTYSETSHTHTFASLTSKPTTLAGYGITNSVNRSEYKNFGEIQFGTGADWTTTDFINHLTNIGFFNQSHSVARGIWYYAGNSNIVDAFGGIELAGTIVESFSNVDHKTIRITCPTTSNTPSAGRVFVYNDQNNGTHSPGWREEITTNSPSVSNWNTAYGWGNHSTAGYATASGTTNYLPKFTASRTIGDSLIYDNGTSVGIGTTTPARRLSIYTVSDLSQQLSIKNNNSTLLFEQTSTENRFISLNQNETVTKDLLFAGYNVTPLLLIKSSGNVGIGTTSPSEKLDVTGNVKATTFIGALSGNATTATTLQNTRSISLGTAVTSTATNFNGSSNITIPVTGVSEAYLTWGGRSFSGSYGPIDSALMPELGANRLAFTPASAVIIEYSQDGGTTWLNYAVSDAVKINLLNGNSTTIQVGGGGYPVGTDYTNYLVRVTINTAGQIYTALNKFIILLSTNGSTGSYCTIDARTQSNYLAGIDTWTIFSNRTPVDGWSGYNVINTNNITTFGNTPASQFGQVRFTFGQTGYSTSYKGLQIFKILGFGGVGWQTPSTLAATGQMYTYDYLKNVYFQANLTAVNFIGALSGNAATATTLQTARTLTIGNTGKTFNGSANVAWSLSEIGAQPAGSYAASSHTHVWTDITNRPTNVSSFTNDSGYITSSGSTSGYSGTLIAEDNRTIAPSELAASRMKFGFTSWNNNNTSPYADFIHLRSYQDSSGGNDNLVMFRKDTIGMRIYQQTFGSSTAYSSYKDVAFTDSSITGNAATATTLQTARTINGTSFNGSADITTATWGTSRTITIGSTGKTVDGSGNISWTLAEIGAQASLANPITGTATSGQVAFFNGTTTQTGDTNLFWDNTNKRLGIGLTSPSEKLDVSGYVKATGFKTPSGTATQFLMADGSVSTLTNPITGTGTTNYIPKFTASGAIGNSLIYDNGTNVGIGTTTPSARLDVNGNMIVGAGTKLIGGFPFYISDPSNLGWKVADSSGTAKFELYVGYSGINQMRLLGGVSIVGHYQDLSLGTSAYLNILNISNTNGNVGIGTTSPVAKLDVNGDIVLRTGIITGEFGSYTTLPLAHAIKLGIPGRDYMDFYEYGGIFNFYQNTGTPSLLMTIRPAGVGIGTTSPSTLLDVNSWATFLNDAGNRLKIWDGTDNIPTISADNLLALESPTIQFYATDVTDSNNNSIYLKLKTVNGNVTIDNSYHNKIVRITASCTITIPAGLRTDFNCTFEVIGAYTAQFVDGSGATTSAPFGRYLKTDLTAMFYCTGTASNYRLNGSLTTS